MHWTTGTMDPYTRLFSNRVSYLINFAFLIHRIFFSSIKKYSRRKLNFFIYIIMHCSSDLLISNRMRNNFILQFRQHFCWCTYLIKNKTEKLNLKGTLTYTYFYYMTHNENGREEHFFPFLNFILPVFLKFCLSIKSINKIINA